MNKLVICSVGTSIANGCPSQKSLFAEDPSWDEDSEGIHAEISASLARRSFSSAPLDEAALVSAELNSLHKLGITSGDRIVMLCSDNLLGKACSAAVADCLRLRFGISPHDIEIRRIEGLQIHNETVLRECGLKNLVKVMLEYLAGEQYRYSYDIIVNPTGGFKGIVPFLTIMGMLYGRKCVYVFEFAKQLITLPPMPFSFDTATYNRVRDALHFLEEEVAAPEQAFFCRIKNYVPEEHDLFTAFVEPFDETGKVTISPLAYCLLQIDSPEQSCFVSENVIETLRKVDLAQREKIIRLIDNIASPVWRNSHLHHFNTTDLLVIKPGNTTERFAGFMKDGLFYVTLAFANHQEYDRELGKYSKASFAGTPFRKWKLGVHVSGEKPTESSSLQQLLDAEIEKNLALKARVRELEGLLGEQKA